MNTFDVAIVGGGLAGLVAYIYLTKAGRKVIVLEKSSRFGGRGMTINKNGICMNLGAHALYRGGAAFLTFNELGMNLPDGIPSTKAHGVWKREVVAMQYLPKITVVHDFSHIDRIENPGSNIPEMPGIYVAGDWTRHDELLADAAVASGKRAALHILEQLESKAYHHGNGAII